MKKLREEFSELIQAISLGELVEVAGELADCIYVLAGIAVQYGLDIDEILDIVHRSNMTKDTSADGDLIKGSAFKPGRPDLEQAILGMRLRA